MLPAPLRAMSGRWHGVPRGGVGGCASLPTSSGRRARLERRDMEGWLSWPRLRVLAEGCEPDEERPLPGTAPSSPSCTL